MKLLRIKTICGTKNGSRIVKIERVNCEIKKGGVRVRPARG